MSTPRERLAYRDIQRLEDYAQELEKENDKYKKIMKIIIEKIDDATFHGERSFSECLNYIDKLAKEALGE